MPGSPLTTTVSGFTAPIGTETLWEAARRQGKRVGVATWPGADDTGSRRRGDWGLAYVNNPDRPADLVTIPSRQWEPAETAAEAQGIDSRSPVRGVLVHVASGEPGEQAFNLLAVDHTDDRRVNYDSLMVVPPGSQQGFPLKAGQWAELPCRLSLPDGASRAAVCPVKLLALDLNAETRLYFGAVYPLAAYPADFAARLAGQGLFWPGPSDDGSLSDSWSGQPGIDLETWTEQSERFTRFFGDSLLAAAGRPDWDLLMGYIPTIDEAGHQLQLIDPRQPGFSPERRDACARARLRVWQAVDRELARLLAALDLRTTAVVVVSDHGMAAAHTAVDPNGLLRDQGLLDVDAKGMVRADATAAYAVGSGGVAHVYVAAGREDLIPKLRGLFTDWRIAGEAPVERVLNRREAAALHLDHPDSGDLILFFREGYGTRNLLRDKKISTPATTLGMHGYLNTHPDIQAIYLALGAGVPKGRAGTLQNPEVAGLVAAWLGIEKPRPVPPAPAGEP
jgi:hypothetical protein